MNVCAIVPAAGAGKRMHTEKRKQFLLLAGVPILYYSLDILSECKLVSSIVLMGPQDDLSFLTEHERIQRRYPKIQAVLPGGQERQDTVFMALEYLSSTCSATDLVVVHDAVRPFVSEACIAEVIGKAFVTGAAIAAVPVSDTIKKVDTTNMWIDKTEPRESLWAAQTPQCFSFSVLWRAHQMAQMQGYRGTDDAELVERIGTRVSLVMGSYENIKITHPADLELGEYLLQSKGGKKCESRNRL